MPEPTNTALPKYVVGIDVETTSLDPTTGDIIDVAAIRYDVATGKEVDRFEQLTKPNQPLSSEIVSLTGITYDMVRDQPSFAEIKDSLRTFIGTDTLFAHNASFDLGYLGGHGVTLENPMWDTFPLAALTWPEMPSYNLGFLAKEWGITSTVEHRAAADVEMTWHLIHKMREDLHVSKDLFSKIETILTKATLSHYIPLFSVITTPDTSKLPLDNTEKKPISKPEHVSWPLSVTEIFAPNGVLESAFLSYESRPEQLRMAQTIEKWLAEDTTGLIEAGTGVGKTFAYLAPVLLNPSQKWPVIISTYTKQLQDQLISHDLPRLLGVLGQKHTTAVLKGRRNYLCSSRLAQVLGRPSFLPSEAFLLLKVLVWLERGGTGDLEQLNTSHQDNRLLWLIHADTPHCRTTCKRTGECIYQQARRKAQAADIVVVNHALLTQMSAGNESRLPATILVIDEAHHLEEAARQASRIDLTVNRVAEILAPLVHQGMYAEKVLAGRIQETAEALRTEYEQWLTSVGNWVIHSSDETRVLLTQPVRRSQSWQKVMEQGMSWRSRLTFLVGLVRGLKDSIPKQSQPSFTEALYDAERYQIEVSQFIEGNSERIQWVDVYDNPYTKERQVQLYDLALSLGALLAPGFSAAHSVVLTSATLTINGSFGYIKKRLGLDDAQEMRLGTPFNLRDNMLLYLAENSPAPSASTFESYTAKIIYDVALQLNGRTLGLFTSQKSVLATYKRLNNKLNKAQIKLYAQKVNGGRKNILERFKAMPESVLLGTMSFWEGVDVQGESLSCVVIPKLPFPAPNDPVITAVAMAEGLDPFLDLAVPRMIITLSQGIGRLIRSATDRGVVVLLDSRIHYTSYGSSVIKSLPAGTIHIGESGDLIPTLKDWFGAEVLQRMHDDKMQKGTDK